MKYFFFLVFSSCSINSCLSTSDLQELQRVKTNVDKIAHSDALESNSYDHTMQNTNEDKCNFCESKKHAGQSFDPKMLSEVEKVIRQLENKKRS